MSFKWLVQETGTGKWPARITTKLLLLDFWTLSIIRYSEKNIGDSRCMHFRYLCFCISAVLFHYHGKHQYPIRGHSKSCCAGPLSCAHSFADSPHHFEGLSYWTTQKIHRHLYIFNICSNLHERNPTYNDSHLYNVSETVSVPKWKGGEYLLSGSVRAVSSKYRGCKRMTIFWDVAPCSLVDTSTRLHGTTSQKTVIFIFTAMRAWNLTHHGCKSWPYHRR
jgi:hypothetical protein